ncbi:hypothetical protein BCR44DRAFT_1462349 [Catenaria anguillulae PL171]|uniref:Uncharacterized protein n=1 Tax=Catenaria anguillulae PL171 TaxID=765915 RepID=A0A1Y2HGB9_9FUNG|nr:hypothetical protein BCR44DRAFT_1462349 [Catenaria anguillulae PL171]
MADAQYCANVADSIHRAATRLVSAVQLATTARVRVSFFSKCFDSTCPDTLAATVPSRSLTVWVPDADSTWDPESDDIRRRTGRLVEYPQLVLRNLAARQNSQLLANSGSLLDPEYDVHMRLSADQHWWFPPPPSPHHSSHKPSSRIAPNQFDLSMVVLHELVHALGFGGVNLMQAGNGVNMMLPIAELKSVKDAGDDVGNMHQEVVRFRAPSVFESHLTAASDAATTTMLSDLARDITSAVDDAVHLPANIDTVNQALGHPSALHAASTLYSLATTPGAVTFSASPGGASAPGAPLMIETALTPLSPGSSLAHISQARYAESPDFLMTYQIPRGKSLDQLIGALGAGESGLGPRTLDVIRALGFKVKGRGDGDGGQRRRAAIE